YVTAIRPTADIDRFGFPAWHGWAISKAWRDGYAAAINEGGQAGQSVAAGEAEGQKAPGTMPVPPSPDAQSVDGILARLYGHPDGTVINSARRINDAIATLRAERDALRADAERYRWLRAAQSQTARNWIVINNRNMYGEHELDAAIDAARKERT
ncbi:MAG: hypothetical protein IT364_16495, partial [Candidatus Hydrogenedentes bacterium]|nr:hypothetical protein [Candidatus Hydrogenedentota bacterium]